MNVFWCLFSALWLVRRPRHVPGLPNQSLSSHRLAEPPIQKKDQQLHRYFICINWCFCCSDQRLFSLIRRLHDRAESRLFLSQIRGDWVGVTRQSNTGAAYEEAFIPLQGSSIRFFKKEIKAQFKGGYLRYTTKSTLGKLTVGTASTVR